MLDDTSRYDANQELAQGTPVYDVNGDKVGTVADVDQINNTVIIQKGWFFPKDFPAPMSVIARANADGVYLNVSKDDVTRGNFTGSGMGDYPADPTDRMVDTQTPYNAGVARSVGDEDLGARGAAAAATTRADLAAPPREDELIAGTPREETGYAHLGQGVSAGQLGADSHDLANASDTGYDDDFRTSDQVNDDTPTSTP